MACGGTSTTFRAGVVRIGLTVAEEVSVGILDAIRDAQAKAEPKCMFAEFIDSLSEQDRSELVLALEDPSITTKAIFVACRKHSYTGGDTVVRRHRRGECICH